MSTYAPIIGSGARRAFPKVIAGPPLEQGIRSPHTLPGTGRGNILLLLVVMATLLASFVPSPSARAETSSTSPASRLDIPSSSTNTMLLTSTTSAGELTGISISAVEVKNGQSTAQAETSTGAQQYGSQVNQHLTGSQPVLAAVKTLGQPGPSPSQGYPIGIMLAGPEEGLNLKIELSETLSIAHAIIKHVGKVLSEGWASGDNLARATGFFRGPAENLAIGDALEKGLRKKMAEEAFAAAEAVRKRLGKAVADSWTLTATFNRQATYSRSISQGLSIADLAARLFQKPIAEPWAIAPSLANSTTKSVTDSLAYADSFDRRARFVRGHDETLISMALATKQPQRVVTEALTIASTPTRSVTKQASESLALPDTLAKSFNVSRAQGITITELATKRFRKAPGEAITITEATAKSLSRIIGEALTPLDTFDRKANYYIRRMVDLFGISDTETFAYRKSVRDDWQTKETTARGIGKGLDEPWAMADTRSQLFDKLLSDLTLVGDISDRSSIWFRSFSDDATLKEVAHKTQYRRLPEALLLQYDSAKAISKLVSEGLREADILSQSVRYIRGFTEDTISITESWFQAAKAIFLSEVPLKPTASLAKKVNYSRHLEEALGNIDSLSKWLQKLFLDTIGYNEMGANSVDKDFSEAVGAVGEAERAALYDRDLAEEMPAIDGLRKEVHQRLNEEQPGIDSQLTGLDEYAFEWRPQGIAIVAGISLVVIVALRVGHRLPRI